MFFTKDDYLKIENWLKSRAVKDSDFKVINSIYGTSDDNYLVILQGNENKRIKIDDFLSDIISQDLGNATNKTISQKGITDSLTELTVNTPVEGGTGVDSVIQKGGSNVASGDYSFAVGISTKAIGNTAHSEGNSTTASGENSHAEGLNTTASGDNSHTEGYKSVASGLNSHAEGYNTAANNTYSHSEGGNTISNGKGSHAEGYNTLADNNHSHAEGFGTKAYSLGSHTEGFNTIAGIKDCTNGCSYSHAEGHSTEAIGQYSHTEGYKTQTVNSGEHSEGILNKSIVGKTIHTVGIGSADDRKNAHEIHLDGSHYIVGIGGYDGKNSQTAQSIQTVLSNIQSKTDDICEVLEYTMSEEGVPSQSDTAKKLIETDEQRAHNLPIYQKLINQELKHIHINILMANESGVFTNVEFIGNYYVIKISDTSSYGMIYGSGFVELNVSMSCGIYFNADGLYEVLLDGVSAYVDNLALAPYSYLDNYATKSEVTALETRIAELENIIQQITKTE